MVSGEPDGTKRIHIKRTAATGCAEIDDRSADATAYRYTEDPGEIGSESLPLDLCGEITRLRHALKEIIGKTYWYESPAIDLKSLSLRQEVHETADSIAQTVTYQDMTGMSITLTATGKPVLIVFTMYGGIGSNNAVGNYLDVRLVVDGSVKHYGTLRVQVAGIDVEGCLCMSRVLTLAAGSHTIKVQWRCSAAGGGYHAGANLSVA